jgi:hypothetical protein
VLLANTVFGVPAAAVVQHKAVLVEPDIAQLAKLEVQQRLWPRCGRAKPAALLPFNLPTPLEFRVLAFGGVAPEK